jgi:hypothetical protein
MTTHRLQFLGDASIEAINGGQSYERNEDNKKCRPRKPRCGTKPYCGAYEIELEDGCRD